MAGYGFCESNRGIHANSEVFAVITGRRIPFDLVSPSFQIDRVIFGSVKFGGRSESHNISVLASLTWLKLTFTLI